MQQETVALLFTFRPFLVFVSSVLETFHSVPIADAAYGFGPAEREHCHLPLCEAGMGSHALYVESSPGLEDWHPIQGGGVGHTLSWW